MTDSDENDPDDQSGGSRETDYEIGYAKPPKAMQFKPGNKRGKGRPKGAKNTATIVNAAFGTKVAAQIGGKKVKASKFEIAMHQLANLASSGNLKAISKAIDLHQQYGPQETPDDVFDEETAYNIETLKHYLQMKGEIPIEDHQHDQDHDDD